MGRYTEIVTPEGRLAVPKVRAFVDFAVPRLKAEFARLADLRERKEKPAAARGRPPV